jgi:putative ABC transport system substrate-binding protein
MPQRRSENLLFSGLLAEIDTAFGSLVQMGTDALIVNDPFFVNRRDQIVTLAAGCRIPGMYFSREFTEAGGLLSYGASLIDAARQGGVYAGKILHGEKPSGLPVIPTMLALADEVVE